MKTNNVVRRSTCKASNEASSSKLLVLFTPRPTNCALLSEFWGPLRGGQGEVAYSWWEDITYVTHRFVLHAGREMDIVERLQLAEDDTKLIHELEIYAEGRVVKFPFGNYDPRSSRQARSSLVIRWSQLFRGKAS